MSYHIIEANREVGRVKTLCRALGVAVSGYYAWRTRPPSQHQQTDAVLLKAIRAGQQAGRGLDGSPRIPAVLQQQGLCCSRKRVARLMRQHGIHSRRRPKRRVRTTDSRHHRPVAPNLLKRDFSAEAPNEKWVGDIVGLWTDEGWLYLAALLDTYSRMIVGWAMSVDRDEALVTDATLRAELTDLERFATRQAARTVVFEFIEVFYNRQRLQSSLDYRSPVAFETDHLS